MSDIDEVRTTEKKVRELQDALRVAGPGETLDLSTEFRNATEAYAKAIRELQIVPDLRRRAQ